MKPRRRFLNIHRTRHGRTVYYFRRGQGPRIRLPDDYGSAEFWNAYKIAFDSGISVYVKPHGATFDETRKSAIGLAMQRAIGRARAKSTEWGRDFDLTYEWAIEAIEAQGFKCALSGIPFYMKHEASSSRDPYMPSIDRIDSRGGYTKENCRLVVYAMNAMLMDWGIEVFERVANGYRSTKGTKRQLLFPHRKSCPPHLKKDLVESTA